MHYKLSTSLQSTEVFIKMSWNWENLDNPATLVLCLQSYCAGGHGLAASLCAHRQMIGSAAAPLCLSDTSQSALQKQVTRTWVLSLSGDEKSTLSAFFSLRF